MIFKYSININERGLFDADVRGEDGNIVYNILCAEDMNDMIELGIMKHNEDTESLESHLKDMDVIGQKDIIIKA